MAGLPTTRLDARAPAASTYGLALFFLFAAATTSGRQGEPATAENSAADKPAATDTLTSQECRDWLGARYKVAALAAELELELDEMIADTNACVDRDLGLMPPSIPRGWCDNVFKVHCPGLDLIGEIGDALVKRCERQLSDDLGFDAGKDPAWTVCGQERVFDAYSHDGETSDAAACRRILVEDCGTEGQGADP